MRQIPWNPDEMTDEELIPALESMESDFESCREIEQGFSTKDVIRYRRTLARAQARFPNAYLRNALEAR